MQRTAFSSCLAATAAGCAWLVVGANYVDLAPGPIARTLLFGVALPGTLLQVGIFLVVWLLASVPHLQAFIAFFHVVKFFPATSSAGPFLKRWRGSHGRGLTRGLSRLAVEGVVDAATVGIHSPGRHP